MSSEDFGSAACENPDCVMFRFDRDAALREGWDTIEGRLYCDLHAPVEARKALATRELEALRARTVRKNAKIAQTELNVTDYAVWDQFQSDLADYHRSTGKLAPAVLRTLDPRKFKAQYDKTGRIDVELVAESLQADEDRANKTRNWLLERL